jgi:hypothetical protein
MISAFGVEHGLISKDLNPLGFGNQARIPHPHHPLPVRPVAEAGRHVAEGSKMGRGKAGLALAGAGAVGALGAYTANKTLIQPARTVARQRKQRNPNG